MKKTYICLEYNVRLIIYVLYTGFPTKKYIMEK